MSEVGVAIINVGVLWFLALLSVHTDDENHAPLKLFFILGSVWMAVNTMSLAGSLAVEGSLGTTIINAIDRNFWLVVVMAIITSMYFSIYYVKEVFETTNRIIFRRRNKIGKE